MYLEFTYLFLRTDESAAKLRRISFLPLSPFFYSVSYRHAIYRGAFSRCVSSVIQKAADQGDMLTSCIALHPVCSRVVKAWEGVSFTPSFDCCSPPFWHRHPHSVVLTSMFRLIYQNVFQKRLGQNAKHKGIVGSGLFVVSRMGDRGERAPSI